MGRKGKSAIEAERQARRQLTDEKFRARHPQVARAERAFRKDRAERERNFSRRDKLQDGGTPETRARAAKVHQGSLARLYERGHITIEQLAASQQIRGVAERLGRDVAIGTVSMETRVDQSRSGTGAFFEALGAVRAEVAYKRWCEWLGTTRAGAAPVLAMVVDDLAATAAGKRWFMRPATARKALSTALDKWADIIGAVCSEIEEPDLLAMQAGLV
ncbi:hypothetical protein [Qipengyuania sp.]|uniref:hypothetical protein n=1 Tax=Qipengyuania sp. TaxID=2004515 RepID=UPI0035132C26